jgi:hypothetical protein
MALFTKLKQRVVGNGLSFDSLENISKKEDEKAADFDDIPVRPRDNSNVSVFSKERRSQQNDIFTNPKSQGKIVNILPSNNSENVPPTNKLQQNSARDDTGKQAPTYRMLEKKSSFRTESNESVIPPVDNPPAVQDNRFATSRTNSFVRQAAPATAPSVAPSVAPANAAMNSVRTESMKSSVTLQSSSVEEVFDVQSDEGEADDDELEMVFSKTRHNHADVVIAAIQKGFNVNSIDSYGNTIMHICAQNNHRKLASALLQRFPQCSVNTENFKGLTPLDYSDKYGFQKMSNWLASAGAVNGGQAAAHSVSKMR